MKCPYCAEEIADGSKKCPVCKENLTNTCKFCKEEIADGAIKCRHCGSMQNPQVNLNSDAQNSDLSREVLRQAGNDKNTSIKNGNTMNTSGMGEQAIIPPELRGWSWGAFFFSWVWGIFNNSLLTLLTFIPFFGFIWIFVCGAKGNEWAWKNKRWDNVEHFKKVQKKWAVAALCVFLLAIVIPIFLAIAISAHQGYIDASHAKIVQ